MKLFLLLLLGMLSFGSVSDEILKAMPSEHNATFPFEMAKSPFAEVNMFQYLGVLSVLVGLFLILWYVKKRLKGASQSHLLGLFDKNSQLQIIYQKNLNMHVQLVIFEAYDHRYIIAVSNQGITLLDKSPLIEFQQYLDEQAKE